jgi:hypothetical protein
VTLIPSLMSPKVMLISTRGFSSMYGQRKAHYTAILCPFGERRKLGGMACFEFDHRRLQRNAAMFVDVPEPMQNPQFAGLVAVPCVIWLKLSDDRDGLAGHTAGCVIEALAVSPRIDPDDREAGAIVVTPANAESECCDEMIQRSTETRNEIAGHQCEAEQGRFQAERNHIFAALNVILGLDRIGLVCLPQVTPDLFIEQAKVVLCPTNLETRMEVSRSASWVDDDELVVRSHGFHFPPY